MEAGGSAQPLSQFPIVRTSKLDAARDAVTRVYLPHRLDSADGDRLQMTLNAAEAARLGRNSVPPVPWLTRFRAGHR